MRKKITFDHAWEIAKWMEENEGIKLFKYTVCSDHFQFSENSFKTNTNIAGNSLDHNSWSIREFYIEVDWRESLEDKPVLCRVWDCNKSSASIGVVTSIDKDDDEYPYETEEEAYENAEPLTKEEAMQYVLECQS